MRKLLLSGFAMFASVCMFAQTGAVSTPRLVSKPNFKIIEQNATGTSSTHTTRTVAHSGSSRTVSTIPLGSAGNAYGSISSTMNQVSYNTSTNQIIFIHRTNNKIFTSDDANNGQYRYDVSRDGGATWTVNRGLLNPSGSEAGFACRFPNATMYNPASNTDPDSSYLAYFGSFHGGGTGADWQGYCTGRARLDNSISTYTERKFTPNSGNTGTAGSLVQSAPGIFWAVDEYVINTDGTDPSGISLYKGVWDADTNGVVWSAPLVISPPLDNTADGKRHINASCIAFDPSGQFGWIAASADVTNDGEGTFDPIFYKTTDGGATWSSMIALDLDSISGIVFDPINGPASTSFELGLTVDIDGNPHLGVVVLPGSTATPFSVLGNAPDKYAYDITYNSTFNADCQWRAIRLDYINSLRKDIGDASMDNYLKASRSEDGSKVFFSWADSDSSLVGANQDNDVPNFKLIGIDVVNNTITAPKNFTAGDAAWDGEVLWPQTSPLARFATGTYNIPTVFVRLNAAQSDLDTTYFHYVSDINIASTEFSNQLDNQAPDISIIGSSLGWVALNGSYIDSGAVAYDCYDGDLTSSIAVTRTIDSSVVGVYTIRYSVTDAAGNTANVERTVRVATIPSCAFTVTNHPSIANRVNFQYANPGNSAVTWSWNYGNSQGVVNSTNGNIPYTYPVSGTYVVRFCATNPIGTCCDSMTINVSGIQTIDLNDNITAYPNPANDLINLSIDLNAANNVVLSLTNLVGEVVYSKELGNINGSVTEKINVSSLEAGMYILRMTTEDGVATKKITINK